MNRRSCDRAIAQVYFYLDGEITWLRKTRVKWHLRSCKRCSRSYSFEGHLKEVVRDRLHEEPQPEVIDRLTAFLRENGMGSGH